MNKDEQYINKAYQALQQEEPVKTPPELDAAILAESRRAVSSAPQLVNADKPKRSAILRWSAPFATAALVVLSVSIYTLQPGIEQQTDVSPYTYDVVSAEPTAASAEIIEEEAKSVSVPSPVVESQQLKELVASTPVHQQGVTANADKPLNASVPSAALAEKKVKIQPAPKTIAKPLVAPKVMAKKSNPEITISQSAERMEELAYSAPEAAITYSAKREWSSADVELKEDKRISAEAWIEKITALIEADKLQSADKAFRAFRRAYPEHAFIKQYPRLLEASEED